MESKRSSTRNKQRTSQLIDGEAIKTLFEQCSDVVFSTLQFGNHEVTLVYCVGLISNDMLHKTVPLRLAEFFRNPLEETINNSIHLLQLPSLQVIENIEKAEKEVFSGKLLLIFNKSDIVYSVDISDRPQRNPEETSIEVSIKGPRDNFIEDIVVNQALIRKRLRTTSLICEPFEVGKRTKTKVSLLFMKDIADPTIITQIRTKIMHLDLDGLHSGTQLGELINNNPYSIFPRHTYTGRPDFAVQSLLNGRFVVLIDGVSYAYLAPINLFFLLKSSEDIEANYFYGAFERLIRVVGISVAVFLPAFWVALTTFHQNQIPFSLLATVIESRKGVPLPSSLEAILMLLLFEVFREAGLRLPLAVGQTLSVIGGLIIGDAAIRAGLTSPAMLVVIAGSTVATFTLVNQTLAGIVSLFRILIILLVSLLGFFGFFVSVFILGTMVARINSFGVPYLHIALNLSMKNVLKAIIKIPEQKVTKRPSSLNPNDSTKKGGPS